MNDMSFFRLAVLPMGWAWSVFMVQLAQRNALSVVLPSAPWVFNGLPTACFGHAEGSQSCAKALFIDNFAAIGVDKAEAVNGAHAMVEELARLGVASTMNADVADCLGFSLEDFLWTPSKAKSTKLERSSFYLHTTRDPISGQQLESFVGVFMHVAVLRSEILAVLSSTYRFIQDSYLKKQPLWNSVQKEMRWIWSLLPLLVARADRELSSTVYAYDASLTGVGICAGEWEPKEVDRHAKLRERARFRGLLTKDERDFDGLTTKLDFGFAAPSTCSLKRVQRSASSRSLVPLLKTPTGGLSVQNRGVGLSIISRSWRPKPGAWQCDAWHGVQQILGNASWVLETIWAW